MEITWLGHSSFLIKDSKGRKILMDPFDESVGYDTFKGDVNLVTISHHHFDHDYLENVKYEHALDKVGFFYLCDIPITAVPSYHDKVQGAKRGENTIFILTIDDYKICHLGDLGYVLSKDDIEKIGNVDILLIPIGGNFTLDGKEASEVAKLVNSHIVIPMHYKTPMLSFELEGLENFLNYMKNGKRIGSNTLTIEGSLDDKNKVMILDYKKVLTFI